MKLKNYLKRILYSVFCPWMIERKLNEELDLTSLMYHESLKMVVEYRQTIDELKLQVKDKADNAEFYEDARKEMGLICESLFIEFDDDENNGDR